MSTSKNKSASKAVHTREDGCRTRNRILDTTERLIAANGVKDVSVRDISRTAKVNLAAINYHFGSKENLLAAVIERRISSVNAARIAKLDELEAEAAGSPIPVSRLMEAFMRPCFGDTEQLKKKQVDMAKMMGRFFLEAESLVVRVAKGSFAAFNERFIDLLQKAVPTVSARELEWRTMLAMGVMHHHLMFSDASKQKHPSMNGMSVEDELAQLVNFCTAGLCSAPTGRVASGSMCGAGGDNT